MGHLRNNVFLWNGSKIPKTEPPAKVKCRLRHILDMHGRSAARPMQIPLNAQFSPW